MDKNKKFLAAGFLVSIFLAGVVWISSFNLLSWRRFLLRII